MPDGRAIPESPTLDENVVEVPLHRERIVFKQAPPAEDVCAFELTLGKGGSVPMKHCHARQDEIFRCRRGVLTLDLPEGAREVRPGEEVVLEAGTMHALYNQGSEDVVCDVEYRPAGRNEEFMKIGAAIMEKTGKEVGVLDVAPFFHDLGMFIEGPPRWAQSALLWLLRPIALMLGRKRAALELAEKRYGRPFTW